MNTPGRLEFCIEKHSSTPIVKQIEEQIKIAVMMGVIRNGHTLPSIRDIEKQTGINRNQIHKAYSSLRRSGLLVLIRGKGTIVATAPASPRALIEKCQQLTATVDARARRLGISPTAYARFLSRHAQEHERYSPFIAYVDTHPEIARQTAAEISQLWQVPVTGLAVEELTTAMGADARPHRILANHMMCDAIRTMLPGKGSSVIPIEIQFSNQTIKRLSKIRPASSVLLVVAPQSRHRVRFMESQLRRWMQSSDVEVSSISIKEVSSFKGLLNAGKFDWLIVGPGVRGNIPSDLRRDPRVILLEVQLNPASLEAARILAGAIV